MVQASRERGHTLLELVVAMTISGVLLVALGVTIEKVFAESIVTTASEESRARVLKSVVFELEDAQLSTLVLSSSKDAPTISYSRIVGWTTSGPSVGATETISFDSGKILHDGLIIAEGVSNLFFNRDGSILTVTVVMDQTQKVGGEETVVSHQVVSRLKL